MGLQVELQVNFPPRQILLICNLITLGIQVIQGMIVILLRGKFKPHFNQSENSIHVFISFDLII